MKSWVFIFSALLVFTFVGCSHTPGDAAWRSGHPLQAAKLFRSGAEYNDGVAALKLGLLIESGDVKESEFGNPAFWYERACELENMTGCHNLGVCFENGKGGVSRDITQAVHFYLMAAERGYIQAQYNLGSLYSNQYVSPSNDLEGYKWILLAQKAAQGRKGAVSEWILKDPPGHKARLKSRLTEGQIKEAERIASIWKQK